MAAGKINLQANDGAVVGLVIPDGLGSGERQIALGVNLSGITAYHLLEGNLSVSNEVLTNGFSTTLYTGNGSTQSINTGIDMDTQWGNDASEKFGGLVWCKSRSIVASNHLQDTIRGATNYINTNSTNAQATLATIITAFSNNGFSIGSDIGLNQNTATYASWNFQTTHRKTGTTNHGKAYTEHYNPFTGFTIIKYEGSGLTGHEIPHSLGRKLGFATVKNLSAVIDWLTYYGTDNMYMAQNLTIAGTFDSGVWSNQTDTAFRVGGGPQFNQASSQHIMYGWANSYFDESNKLIGNYEVGVYQGTGVAGNKVKTKGKPAWVMIKRLDSTGNWAVFDNMRNLFDSGLLANSSSTDIVVDYINIVDDGIVVQTVNSDTNASGGQYLYMVVYDNDSGSGKSKYPRATDSSNLTINNAIIPFAEGIDSNGTKVSTLSKNETITGLTYTQGKNYVYCDKNGTYGVTSHKPRYLESELVRTYASEQPDYFSIADNKWYSCDAGSELVTNGTFDVNTTGWTTTTGFAISIQNGTLKIDRNIATPTGGVYQNITTTVGKKYRLTLDINYISGGGVSVWVDSGNTLSSYITVLGKQLIEFTAVNSSTKIEFLQIGVAGTGTIKIDTVTCFATDIVPTTEITNSRNYLNHIVHADNDGGVLYVEELPKIEYKDIVKANEFKGKNACTMWAILDCTTTPITIKDSYNVAYVTRLGTGDIEIMPLDLDLSKVTVIPGGHASENPSYTGLTFGAGVYNGKIRVTSRNYANTQINLPELSINVYGGKN